MTARTLLAPALTAGCVLLPQLGPALPAGPVRAPGCLGLFAVAAVVGWVAAGRQRRTDRGGLAALAGAHLALDPLCALAALDGSAPPWGLLGAQAVALLISARLLGAADALLARGRALLAEVRGYVRARRRVRGALTAYEPPHPPLPAPAAPPRGHRGAARPPLRGPPVHAPHPARPPAPGRFALAS
ncbi:hypothetical protein [Streptomyces sp. MAR4 CNX-425]|uniref:hypothetical protein n=1 Tax=Streptomyces sp. MAR4 CNX-425 TaxID=3406343 RepID=UPI003B510F68